MADGEDFNGKIIEEFRTNGGKVGEHLCQAEGSHVKFRRL